MYQKRNGIQRGPENSYFSTPSSKTLFSQTPGYFEEKVVHDFRFETMKFNNFTSKQHSIPVIWDKLYERILKTDKMHTSWCLRKRLT